MGGAGHVHSVNMPPTSPYWQEGPLDDPSRDDAPETQAANTEDTTPGTQVTTTPTYVQRGTQTDYTGAPPNVQTIPGISTILYNPDYEPISLSNQHPNPGLPPTPPTEGSPLCQSAAPPEPSVQDEYTAAQTLIDLRQALDVSTAALTRARANRLQRTKKVEREEGISEPELTHDEETDVDSMDMDSDQELVELDWDEEWMEEDKEEDYTNNRDNDGREPKFLYFQTASSQSGKAYHRALADEPDYLHPREPYYRNEDGFTLKRAMDDLPPRCYIPDGLITIGGKTYTLRELLVASTHNRLQHCGIDKTYQALRNETTWPGQYGDVTRFVQPCDSCQRNKQPTQKPPGRVHMLQV